MKRWFNHKKKLKTNEKIVLIFTIFYVFFFTLMAIQNKNYEFVFYTLIFLVLIDVTIYIHREIELPYMLLVGLSVLGLLHILGGNVILEGVRLYEIDLLYGIQYDNYVHAFGTFLVTFIVYDILQTTRPKRARRTNVLFYVALFLMALGVGSINELIELTAVVYFDAANGVGDYLNNATDILFNSIGSLIAIISIYFYRRYHHNKGVFSSLLNHFKGVKIGR